MAILAFDKVCVGKGSSKKHSSQQCCGLNQDWALVAFINDFKMAAAFSWKPQEHGQV